MPLPERETSSEPGARVDHGHLELEDHHKAEKNVVNMPTYTVRQIADRLGGGLVGSSDIVIGSAEQIDIATRGQITFISDVRYARRWPRSEASAALVSRGIDLEPGTSRALIQVDNADAAMATVLAMFAPPAPRPNKGTHPIAVIDPSAELAPGTAIGPGCTIGKDVKIGQGCVLHANVSVLDETTLGNGCVLFPGVVVYDRCELGSNVIVHANAVIGADGFGYQPGKGGPVKVPQIGYVQIGDNVEIGAGTCIDRGKFSATVIGEGTKIDNLCQIGHNCRIGAGCLLAAQVGLSGSVTLGDGVIMGGQAGVADHLTIGAGASVAGKSGVIHNIPPGEVWFGYPAQRYRDAFRGLLLLRQLPELLRKVSGKSDAQSDEPGAEA